MSVVYLSEIVNPSDLARGVAERFIRTSRDGEGLVIYNYTDRAQVNPSSWSNPAVRKCRGLIVNKGTGEVVARPWEKFFNYGQAEAGELDLDAPVQVTDKVDGSLGIIYRSIGGEWRVATRGSFASPQALHATRLLHAEMERTPALRDRLERYDGGTVLVEIVYPENRIVLDYGDSDELVLLGSVCLDSGVYCGPVATERNLGGWPWRSTRCYNHRNLREALAAPPRPNAEGLCVRFLHEDKIVKIKQEDYVRLHRIVFGLSAKTVWEHAVAGCDLESLLAPLPDELHEWVRAEWRSLDREVTRHIRYAHALYEFALAGMELDGFDETDRAEFARRIRGDRLASLAFMLYDDKSIHTSVLKMLKPKGHRPAKLEPEGGA